MSVPHHPLLTVPTSCFTEEHVIGGAGRYLRAFCPRAQGKGIDLLVADDNDGSGGLTPAAPR